MASASKSTTLYANAGAPYTNATLTAYFGESSTSVANNTSTIDVTAYQTIGNASWSSSYASSLQIFWFDNNANTGGKLVATTSVTSQSNNGTITATGTITVTHKSDGTLSGYATAVWTKGGSSSYTPNSGSVSTNGTALTNIPRAAKVVSAPDFTDADNPTITYSNPAGNYATTLQAGIFNTAGTTAYASYRDLAKDGTTYTFNLTTAEKNALLSASSATTTLPVRFYIKTIIGGNTYYDYKEVNFSVTDANPTFSASYEDTNSTVTAITGDNQIIVRNQSTLQIDVTDLTAKKSATISTVTANINGTVYNGTISGSTATISVGTINISYNTTATIIATDSRGLTATQTLNITVADWELPTGIITMNRHENYYSQTDIKVDGSYKSVDGHNSMIIKLRYKKTTTSTWSSYTTMQDNVAQTFNLDNEYAWDIQVKIDDLFGSTTYNLELTRGMPIVYFDTTKSSTGFNCFPKDNGSVEINGVPLNCMMTYSLTTAISSATANADTKITLTSAVTSGARLTTASGEIKIGAEITKVKVSGQVTILSTTTAGPCYIKIKDGNTVLAENTNVVPAGCYMTFTIPPMLVSVAENDTVGIYYNVPNSDDLVQSAHLTVEAVA